jgi:hypothetical protein
MKIKKSKAVVKLEREAKEYAEWKAAQPKANRKPRKLTPVGEFFI